MVFPVRAGRRPCSVEGCSGQASTQTAIRVHFWNRHVKYTLVILEEGNLLHPCFPLCNIMVPWKALNGINKRTAQCTCGLEQRRRQLAALEAVEVTSRAFSAYGRPVEMVTSFKYLGRVISATDKNWTAVVSKFF